MPEPLWKVTFKISCPGKTMYRQAQGLVPRVFKHTIHEVAEPTAAAARRHARRVVAKLFPSARCRLTRIVRDRAAEAARKRWADAVSGIDQRATRRLVKALRGRHQ